MHAISDVAKAFGIAVSALRYYDEIGLVPATERRGRVRFYDEVALRRLTYALLWLREGALGVTRAAEVLEADTDDRGRLLADLQREVDERIQGLRVARDMLTHIARCRRDDFNDCPVISGYLDEQVTAMLEAARTEGGSPAPALAWPEFRHAVHAAMDDTIGRAPSTGPRRRKR